MRLDLHEVRFLRRYKRFLADVRWPDGRIEVVHCPNSGSMRTLQTPEVPAWIRISDDPRRKYAGTLTILGLPNGGRALVDTLLPNRLVADAIRAGRIPDLAGYDSLRCEVAYGNERSRIDCLLEARDRPPCYVEVKNCTMASDCVPGRSDFPDSVTDRGARHLRELTAVARGGGRAVQFYLIGRSDCRSGGVASDIDPAYRDALVAARSAGVQLLCHRVRLTSSSASLGDPCPFVID